MIYISTACVHENSVSRSVEMLAEAGFSNIELSGGDYEENLLDTLIVLKRKYSLNYLCHNYFPPPVKSFVLNLASFDKEIRTQSVDLIKKSIEWSKKFGAEQLAFHAGFYIDFSPEEIGKSLICRTLNDKAEALKIFNDSCSLLKKVAGGIQLYIENNVLSSKNYETFQNQNPLMFTHFDEYSSNSITQECKTLLDVGHLYVSAKTLDLDFDKEMNELLPLSEYIHLSDNDGSADQNQKLDVHSNIVSSLKPYNLKDKTITLEVYGSIADIRESYSIVEENFYA